MEIHSAPAVYFAGEMLDGRTELVDGANAWAVETAGAPFEPNNTMGFCPSCLRLRHAARRGLADRVGCAVAVLSRGTQARSLINHAQLVAGLREALSPAYTVSDLEVTASDGSARLLELFELASAALVAPH